MSIKRFQNWMEAYSKSNRLIGTYNDWELRTIGIVPKDENKQTAIEDFIEVRSFITNIVFNWDRQIFRNNEWVDYLDMYIRKLIPEKFRVSYMNLV